VTGQEARPDSRVSGVALPEAAAGVLQAARRAEKREVARRSRWVFFMGARSR
jgi:hypothetical protein